MKLISNVFLITLALYGFGCSEDKNKEIINSEKKELTIDLPKEQPVIDTLGSAKSEPVVSEQPKTIQPIKIEKEVAKTEVKLNPPHGQPGHDCAIPVGSPLNNSQPQNQTPNLKPSSDLMLNTTPTQSGKKLNPAHGEPGHDCAIPVGAPLN